MFERVAKRVTLETGREHITPEMLLEDIFSDSLEYLAFILTLTDLGSLSDEAISKSSTVGELANAIVPAS